MSPSPETLALDGGSPVRHEPLLPGWPGGLLIGDEEKVQVLEDITAALHKVARAIL
jgi:hypothetical protein